LSLLLVRHATKKLASMLFCLQTQEQHFICLLQWAHLPPRGKRVLQWKLTSFKSSKVYEKQPYILKCC
jgi:hypothetical protein